MSRTCGAPCRRLRLEGAPLLHAEPVLLVDDGEREVGERHGLLEHRVRADDDPGLAGGQRLVRARCAPFAPSEPVSRIDLDPEVLEQSADDVVVLPGEEVRGGEQRGLPARRAPPRRAPRPPRPSCPSRRRPGPGGASARHGRGRRGSRRGAATWSGVSATAVAQPCARWRPRADVRIARPSSARETGTGSVWARPRARRRPTMPSWSARSSSKASRRSAASRALERRRVVRGLERLRDPGEALGGADLVRQVLRVGVAGRVEGLAAWPPAAGSPSARW